MNNCEKHPQKDASASDAPLNGEENQLEPEAEIALLEQGMAALRAEKEECERTLKRLRMEEDPENGKIYADEIFRLSQERLKLETEMEIKRKGINRIRYAQNPNGYAL